MDFEKLLPLLENPELASTFLSNMVGRYMPILTAAANELFKAGSQLQALYVESGYMTASAQARKAKYDAYITAGFTEEQAMSLLLTDVRETATLVKKFKSMPTAQNSHD